MPMNAAQFSRARERIERDDHKGEHFQRHALARLVLRARGIRIVAKNKVIGWRLVDGSVVCAKRRFVTRDAGENYMLCIQAQEGKANAPRRVYQCDFCSGFHLTSQISSKAE